MRAVRLARVLTGLLAAAVSLPLAATERPVIRALESAEGRSFNLAAVASARVELDLERLAQRPGRLSVELADGTRLQASRRRFERRGPRSFLWQGRLRGGGDLVLTSVGGRLAGALLTGDRAWEIVPEPGGGHRLSAIEHALLPGCGIGARSGLTVAAIDGEAAVITSASERPRIDVMVLYDAETLERLGDPEAAAAVIQNNVDLTNVAYRNSGVRVRLRLVHVRRLEPAMVALTSSQRLEWLRSDPEVARLRDRHGADVVGFLYGRESSVCGTAAMIFGRGGGAAHAVFDVYLRCGVSSLTFAHEVGHLQGADHNPANAAVEPGSTDDGFGHWYDGEYRTVMSYSDPCTASCPAQPFFSNPEVLFRGLPTGIAGERHNARVLDETAGAVAAFRPAASACNRKPGHPRYCRDCGPCAAEEGDCDGDAECASGLVCARDVGEEFGFDSGVDVCLDRQDGCALPIGHPDRCRLCGPCGFGEGDCDGNADCQTGLVCLEDEGDRYGFASTTDVCGHRAGGYCPYPLGHPEYCAACGPCALGEGGCVTSGDCASGLPSYCAEDVGARFGFAADVDVCLPRFGSGCPFPPGWPDYCRLCGPCGLGEGDCDTEGECQDGLVCVDGGGDEFGYPGTDVCLPPDPERFLAAPSKLRGRALSADSVRLRWQDNSDNEDSFRIEVRIDAVKFEGAARVGADVRSVVLSGLRAERAYTFRVVAQSAFGRSDYSNEWTITTLPRSGDSD